MAWGAGPWAQINLLAILVFFGLFTVSAILNFQILFYDDPRLGGYAYHFLIIFVVVLTFNYRFVGPLVAIFLLGLNGCTNTEVDNTGSVGSGNEMGNELTVFSNSVGMKFVRIAAGSFMMGKSCEPVPFELTKHLSYPNIDELKENFPNGDPDKFLGCCVHLLGSCVGFVDSLTQAEDVGRHLGNTPGSFTGAL